ncbi:MAG: ribosome silencing factor [Myxococcota bacterium]
MESLDLATAAARFASDRKAEDVTVLDLGRKASYCDSFVICTGTSRRHVRALAEGIIHDLREIGQRPIGVEGLDASRWILIDFGDVLVHVFEEPMRGFYDLEAMWADARRIPFEPPAAAARGAAGQTRG